MNPLSAYLHLPFLLAQADTPTDSPADLSSPTGTPAMFTINGQPATPEQQAQMMHALIPVMLVSLLIGLLTVIGLWKVFTKAGKPGWASIIPIYNVIVLLEIAGRPLWWIILFLIPFVNLIVAIIVFIDVAKNFGQGAGFGLGLAFLGPIFLPILGFGSARYVGPGGAPGRYPGGYPPATM